jgi:hypothetical protein
LQVLFHDGFGGIVIESVLCPEWRPRLFWPRVLIYLVVEGDGLPPGTPGNHADVVVIDRHGPFARQGPAEISCHRLGYHAQADQVSFHSRSIGRYEAPLQQSAGRPACNSHPR